MSYMPSGRCMSPMPMAAAPSIPCTSVTALSQESFLAAVQASPVFAATPFFMNDEFSLVDCCVAPLLWRLPMLGIELSPKAKAISDYSRRIFSWPAFKDSVTELEKEMVVENARR